MFKREGEKQICVWLTLQVVHALTVRVLLIGGKRIEGEGLISAIPSRVCHV